MQTVLDKHISIDPGVLGGKPCIAGRRIAVEHVVGWHLREKQSVEEIARSYDLTPASIHAALTYYYDHRAEIDRKLAEDEASIDQMHRRTQRKLGTDERE